ncbi:MAG: hypothetical protein NT154_17055 [Verrucomicrobia bacterium]|nr:hypothetical protein [Verrucomicrobiota bacterium]
MNKQKHLAILYCTCRLATLRVGGACVLALIAAGCSGINASHAVSPLDFFMPGLLQNHPASPILPLETNSVTLLAQASPVPR